MAFVLGILAYMVAMAWGPPPAWIGLFAALPLTLLLATGLYLFALPQLARRKRV